MRWVPDTEGWYSRAKCYPYPYETIAMVISIPADVVTYDTKVTISAGIYEGGMLRVRGGAWWVRGKGCVGFEEVDKWRFPDGWGGG